MKPPGSTPTGITSMSTPIGAIRTRAGGTAARAGCGVLAMRGTSTAAVGAGVGDAVGVGVGAVRG